MSVVSDNIANVNTVGYKGSRATFRDQLNASTAGGFGNARMAAGSGARLADVEQMWSQGALLTTDAPTDLAISGEGFFVVQGEANGAPGTYFSRAGQFKVSTEGYMENSEGLRVQGYTVAADGTVNGQLSDMHVDPGTLPASATTAITISANVDANSSVIAAPFDVNDPGNTSNFSTNITVYDSLGNDHETTVYFRKTAANTWDWHALVDGGEITGGTAGTPVQGANGSLSFTTNGELNTETTAASSWDFLGATPGQAITFDFGTSITTDGGTGLDGSTQFGTPSTTNALSQDVFASGTVAALNITQDGVINGVFTNGQARELGVIALADFTNQDGLQRMGDALWASTTDSGDPLMGGAATGGRGAVISGALEQSNVDIGREFVTMIAFQRGFSASSKIVRTADQMYQELLSVKR